MAHFAQLDENNVVTQVIVVSNDQLKGTVTTEVDGFLVSQTVESEAKGVEFCKALYGADTVWKQTSYNASFRGTYAAIGGTFDGTNFVAPVVEAVVSETPVESLTTTQVDSVSSEPVVVLTTDSIAAISEVGTASISMASAAVADTITIETSNTGV